MNTIITRICLLMTVILLTFIMYKASFPQKKADSLEALLDEQPAGINKINTYEDLITIYSKTDILKAKNYSDHMLKLSQRVKYTEGVIDAKLLLAMLFEKQFHFDSAVMLLDTVIHYCKKLEDQGRLAKAFNQKGRIIYRNSGPLDATPYFVQSHAIYKSLNDSLGLANVLNGLGVMYMRQSMYDSAVIKYHELIGIGEQKGFEEILGKGYLNLGISYLEMDEYDKAEPFLRKSLEINARYNKRLFSLAYNNLGALAYLRNQLEDALELLNKSLKISQRINDKQGIANAYNNIGNIYRDQERYKQAYKYYDKAISIFSTIGKIDGVIAAYKNQGLIHELWGNYDTTLIIYDSCMRIAEKIGSLHRMKELNYNTYQTYYLMEDYKPAFDYLINFYNIKDSIIDLEKGMIIADLEIKYEKEKYLSKNLSLTNEVLEKNLSLKKRTNQRNVYLFTGSGSVLILIFIIAFLRQRTRKNRIIDQQRIHQLEEEKKLLAASSIMEGQEEERKRIAKELHDGLGVLLSSAKLHFTTVRNKSPENKQLVDKAASLLEKASKDVRRISHNMMPGLLTKYGLIEAVESLIEEINGISGINARVATKGETTRINENKEIMIYRIVQEMVNNTLKHADAKNIRLEVNQTSNNISMKYTDDGKGFDTETKIKSKSMGLNSISSRVHFMGGKLEIQSNPGAGVKFSFEIPL